MNILGSILSYKKKNDYQEFREESEKAMSADDLFANLIADYTSIKQDVMMKMRKGYLSQELFLEDVRCHALDSYPLAGDSVIEDGIKLFESYVFGYFRLTELIDDNDVSDIKCMSWKNIRIKKKGVRYCADVQFASRDEYLRFVEYIAIRNEVNISHLNAIQSFMDFKNSTEYNLRFTLIMPLLATYGEPLLHIRKSPKDFMEVEDLIREDMMSKSVADLIVKRFCNGSTLICGGTSSGKTTLLNALKETLPHEMDVMVSQQDDGLWQKNHPGMAFVHSLPKTGESIVSYDLKNISIAGLTMDIDFFIMGEIKGDEAAYVLNAAYTGQIAAATIHAPSADKAIEKCVDYAMQATRYTKEELMKMMSCFSTIIFMDKFKVSQVYEVSGWNREEHNIEYTVLYERK